MAIICSKEKETKINSQADYSWSQGDYRIEISNDIDPLLDVIDEFIPTDYPYLRPAYLKSLWACPPQGYDMGMIMFYKSENLTGVGVLMGLRLDSSASIRYEALQWLKNVYNPVVLSFGNLLVTTDRQYYFSDDITRDEELLYLDLLRNNYTSLRINNKDCPSYLILKEFSSDAQWSEAMDGFGFEEFQVDPAFRLEIREDWKTFSDYLEALKSKYRITARRNQRKGAELLFKELTEEQIIKHEIQINELYVNIAGKALFNSFVLDPKYFSTLKNNMPDDFHLVGVFEEEDLVGFYSYLLSDMEIDAHFIGMKQTRRDHALYANLLYGLVSDGIRRKKKFLNLSRTAPEAKSALGAKFIQYSLFVRHKTKMITKGLPWLFDRLYVDQPWIERHPFRNRNHPNPPSES